MDNKIVIVMCDCGRDPYYAREDDEQDRPASHVVFCDCGKGIAKQTTLAAAALEWWLLNKATNPPSAEY